MGLFSDTTSGADLLRAYQHEEARRWARTLAKSLLVAGGVSGSMQALDSIGRPDAAMRVAFALASMIAASAAALLVARPATVSVVDGRARGGIWALALLWAVSCGAIAQTTSAAAIFMALSASMPLAARRLGAGRWALGAAAWAVTAFATSALVRGGQALEPRSLATVACGPVALVGFSLLLRAFSSDSHGSALTLAGGSVGRYELLSRIGAGGMGEVWEARHPTLKGHVALKLLRFSGPKAAARFEAEARLTAQLVHPNTVRVYDYGVIGNALAYYVMERIPGRNLLALVRAEGKLDSRRAMHILRQVAGALSEAHLRGLVHRDVKPENILVCTSCGEPDVVKMIDFGVAVRLEQGADEVRFTAPGVVVGTPGYIWPRSS